MEMSSSSTTHELVEHTASMTWKLCSQISIIIINLAILCNNACTVIKLNLLSCTIIITFPTAESDITILWMK